MAIDVFKELVRILRKIACYQKIWYFYFSNMVIQEGQRTTMEVISSGDEIPLSTVRLGGMEIPLSEALNMNGSLHLTIGYLLKDEREKLT